MLTQLRNKIDEIDKQLLALFEERMDVTQQVGAYKKANQLPVFVPEREKEVLKTRMAAVQNLAYQRAAADFFSYIMALSRRQQLNIMPNPMQQNTKQKTAATPHKRGAYLGRSGSYSEAALKQLLPNAEAILAADSFAGVLEKLESGEADLAVLPVENTSTGAINDVLDLLSTHSLYIVNELTLPVRHVLAAPQGAKPDDIRHVYSHPQGFLQCADFLRTLNNPTQIPMPSTADSASFVANAADVHNAAIASHHAAELYGLSVLKEDIQSADTNSTRFIAIAKEIEAAADANTLSLAFTLPHTSGSLYAALGVFARHELNLLYIASRPLVGRNFEYMFFADVSLSNREDAVRAALDELQGMAAGVQLLGCYHSNRGMEA